MAIATMAKVSRASLAVATRVASPSSETVLCACLSKETTGRILSADGVWSRISILSKPLTTTPYSSLLSRPTREILLPTGKASIHATFISLSCPDGISTSTRKDFTVPTAVMPSPSFRVIIQRFLFSENHPILLTTYPSVEIVSPWKDETQPASTAQGALPTISFTVRVLNESMSAGGHTSGSASSQSISCLVLWQPKRAWVA
mmetsp:Transcript_7122/g.21365  ORF Transcript_7122/g.21365 Transcript_7122/m.21365 type:complete len:203 (-) Transcript_7122:739-1347(-)